MDIKRQIKIVIILMCISNFTVFAHLDYNQSFIPQLFFLIPFDLILFFILYKFYKRRNWARILIIIGSVLSLLNFLLIFSQYNLIIKVISFLDGILAVYLLYFLNKKSVCELFKPTVDTVANKKPGMPLFLKIIIGIVLAIITLIGGCALAGYYFYSKIKNSSRNIFIEDIKTREVLRVTKSGSNTSPRFSPDGKKIIFSSSLRIGDFKNGATIKLFSLEDSNVTTLIDDGNVNLTPSWMPDGKSIVYFRRNGREESFWLFSLEGGVKKQISNTAYYETTPSLSPDGNYMLYIGKDTKGRNQLFLSSLDGTQKTCLTDIQNILYQPKSPAWFLDSKKIAYISLNKLVVIDTSGEILQEITPIGLSNPADIFFNPQNEDLIYFSARPAKDLSLKNTLYIASRRTEELNILRRADMLEVDHSISPDGTKLIYSRIERNSK